MPVLKFDIFLNNCAKHHDIKAGGAKRQFELGNELCLAKHEYRTKKTPWRPST